MHGRKTKRLARVLQKTPLGMMPSSRHHYQVLPYSKLEPIMLLVYSISAASVCVMLICPCSPSGGLGDKSSSSSVEDSWFTCGCCALSAMASPTLLCLFPLWFDPLESVRQPLEFLERTGDTDEALHVAPHKPPPPPPPPPCCWSCCAALSLACRFSL